MNIYTTTQARAKLYHIVNETNQTHEPIYIRSKRNNAVMLSQEDYESLQETLAIYSVPGLAESILEASKEPLEKCVEWTDEL